MALTQEGRFWFDYDRVDAVLDELMKVPIDRYTVSKSSMDKIKDLLKLDELNEEIELRAVRNAVVDRLYNKMEECDSKNDIDSSFDIHLHISGITAVIDNELWKRGFPV